jgi:hypothetical protein
MRMRRRFRTYETMRSKKQWQVFKDILRQDLKVRELQAKLDAKEEQIKDAIKTVQQVQDVSLERSKEVAKERENLTLDMHRSKDQLVQVQARKKRMKKKNGATLLLVSHSLLYMSPHNTICMPSY